MARAIEVHSNVKNGAHAVWIKLDVRNAVKLASELLRQALKPGATVNLRVWRTKQIAVLCAKKRGVRDDSNGTAH
jgi:hypothetical protein